MNYDYANDLCLLRGGQVLSFGSYAVGLLVKRAIADAQLEAEKPKPTPPGAGAGISSGGTTTQPGTVTTGGTPAGDGSSTTKPKDQAEPPTHFFGSVKVDPARISRDVAVIANEVLQHLASLPHSEVTVTVEIQARVPGGVPDNVVRTVSENCRTLKFKSQNFEME